MWRMPRFKTRFGRVADRRLSDGYIIWLTTVDRGGAPQPRPVWYHWDGSTFLLFSQPRAAKLRHIRRNPRVSLHLNSDREAGEVTVLLGSAAIAKRTVPAARLRSYLRKYRDGLKSIEMTPAEFTQSYSVAVIVRPTKLRGS
jgi:PPOX class probable F420-dependent enzyme